MRGSSEIIKDLGLTTQLNIKQDLLLETPAFKDLLLKTIKFVNSRRANIT